MGKSAKFYKRPTKKEKEGLALEKTTEAGAKVAKAKGTQFKVSKVTQAKKLPTPARFPSAR
ncbi:hypothetical protein BDF14DRAFT_1878951 [Spinellus fusiger]|nr:hypothetical protein BDF14DRAFT_1878951 [Spinellus fusiger]